MGSAFSRRSSEVSGITTAKKTTVAMMRNEINALRNEPYLNTEWLTVKDKSENEVLPKMAAMSGVTRSTTKRGDHRRERGTHDDGHRQIDHVAPQHELLEVAQHAFSSPFSSGLASWLASSLEPCHHVRRPGRRPVCQGP